MEGGEPVIAGIIILAIVVLAFALAMVRCQITVEYHDSLTAYISLVGWKLWCYPKKKKNIRINRYTSQKIEKLNKKEASKKLRRKNRKAARNSKKKKKQDQTAATSSTPKTLPENLGLIFKLLSVVFSRFSHHVKLKATRIIITVATEDAAKTAVLFGAVNQAVGDILTLLDTYGKLEGMRDARIVVAPDFMADKTKADICISLSLRLWHMADILWRAAWRLAKNKKKIN